MTARGATDLGRAARAALVAGLLLAGCRDRAEPTRAEPSRAEPARAEPSGDEIIDLGRSLEAIRARFNAHRGEKRFLTLLSPT
jgi:hypothetical protein